MARKDETPAEAVALEHQVKALERRRLVHLEEMAKGVARKRYLELVGRAKEIAWLIEESAKRARQLHTGDHDEQ